MRALVPYSGTEGVSVTAADIMEQRRQQLIEEKKAKEAAEAQIREEQAAARRLAAIEREEKREAARKARADARRVSARGGVPAQLPSCPTRRR